MDVTIDNFGEVVTMIEQKLLDKVIYFSTKTSYIAFDLEFTGLRF